MKNWLITIANGPRDASRVATQHFTVYAADEAEAENLGDSICCKMDHYHEVRLVEEL